MTTLEEIKPLLEEILPLIRLDEKVRAEVEFWLKIKNKKINFENLSDLAGNHLFDDRFYIFNITKIQGHKIREYFQLNFDNYNSIQEFRKEFSNLLEEENPEYLECFKIK